MKLKVWLSVAKFCMTHVSQSDNVSIWDSEWYTASNAVRDFEYINWWQCSCKSDEIWHDNDHHASLQRSSSLEF